MITFFYLQDITASKKNIYVRAIFARNTTTLSLFRVDFRRTPNIIIILKNSALEAIDSSDQGGH